MNASSYGCGFDGVPVKHRNQRHATKAKSVAIHSIGLGLISSRPFRSSRSEMKPIVASSPSAQGLAAENEIEASGVNFFFVG
jgi:hypothetical protein